MSRKLRTSQANGGARRDRTADLLRARQALSQLSYGPFNLSFSRQPALDLSRAWSHTHMYAPGARAKSALPGGKNPALKNTLAGYLSSLCFFPIFSQGIFRSPLPILFHLVRIDLRLSRSVLVHMSRKLRSSWAKWDNIGGSGWI